jgi:hypothetical protein
MACSASRSFIKAGGLSTICTTPRTRLHTPARPTGVSVRRRRRVLGTRCHWPELCLWHQLEVVVPAESPPPSSPDGRTPCHPVRDNPADDGRGRSPSRSPIVAAKRNAEPFRVRCDDDRRDVARVHRDPGVGPPSRRVQGQRLQGRPPGKDPRLLRHRTAIPGELARLRGAQRPDRP